MPLLLLYCLPLLTFSSPPFISLFFYTDSFKQGRDVDTYNKYLGECQKTESFYYSSMHKWRTVRTVAIIDRVPATLSLLKASVF